ncbi:MAG TPA: outer membrane protein assembly factor, partial [Phycisphaerae bacterium]|nr:outer membrane protein assembly factor [Phycisphaerae bacterium]
IRKIIFSGNENIPDGELRKHITSQTYFWIFRDGKFDEDTVEADAAAVQNFIRDEGYLDARVGYQLDFSDDRRDLTVTFTIAEGRRYYVKDILFEGNTVFSSAELSAGLPLEVGAPIVQRKLDLAVKQITDQYGSAGYIDARVRPTRVFTEEEGYVRVTFTIDEGTQFHVGRIVVRGNERTQDKVIRRELGLYPGELFDLPDARESEQRIRDLRLFESASVAPVGDEPGVRDVLVNIDEGRKAGNFIFGFGVTSNSGLVGSIVLDLNNFDIFDTPRSFTEFINRRAFYGAGQRLRIEAQPGTQLNRFRIDFTEPYLFDKPTRFDYSLYFFERGRESYNERRIGTTVSFGRRLQWEKLKDWYGEIAFRLETARVDSLDLLAPRDVRDDAGSALLTSVKVSLVRDRTDSRFLPTTGDRIRLAYEQFGVLGGEFFGQLSGSYTRHFTVATDELERKSVLSLKGTGAYVVGDAPVYERYYAGGIGSIRGFQFRGVSPRQGLDDDQIGGDFMMLFSSEYSFPLYGKLLRGLLFSDMGTVERNLEIRDWRVAVGTGVRVQVDFFGPIPLEFDLAVPVLSQQEDDEQVFSFFIGATF